MRTATLRHQRSSEETRPGFDREYELAEVLQLIEKRLAALAHIRTPAEYDEQLDAAEAVAGPYAIAFVYEIRRLEQFLSAGQRSGRMGSGRMRQGAVR